MIEKRLKKVNTKKFDQSSQTQKSVRKEEHVRNRVEI
jgi:hypothetical protein